MDAAPWVDGSLFQELPIPREIPGVVRPGHRRRALERRLTRPGRLPDLPSSPQMAGRVDAQTPKPKVNTMPTISRLASLAAAAVAASTLSACGNQTADTATSTPAAATHAPLTCRQKYEQWKHGPAKTTAHRLTSALRKVETAADNEDLPALRAGLRTAGRFAADLGKTPPPACSDPAGYYARFIGLLKAAGDNAGTGDGSLMSLTLALAPLKKLPPIEKKLSKELNRIVGPNH